MQQQFGYFQPLFYVCFVFTVFFLYSTICYCVLLHFHLSEVRFSCLASQPFGSADSLTRIAQSFGFLEYTKLLTPTTLSAAIYLARSLAMCVADCAAFRADAMQCCCCCRRSQLRKVRRSCCAYAVVYVVLPPSPCVACTH